MFAHFRRHRWLWVIIFGATILSFVWWLGPAVGSGGAFRGSGDVVGTVYGRDVSRREYGDAFKDATFEFFFRQGGTWPSDIPGAQAYLERATRDRLVLMDQVRSFGIRVSDETKMVWISDTFRDQTGSFSRALFDDFKNKKLPQARMGLGDLDRFIEHQIAIQHLVSLVGGGGLVTPQEAELRYRREFEEVDTEIAILSVTNFMAQLTNLVDLPAITAYYTDNQARYRVPEKRTVRYIRLDTTDFSKEAAELLTANVTNVENLIEQTFLQKGGTNFYLDENSKPLTPEAAKELIRADVRREAALASAQRKAVEYANELLDKPPTTNLFRTFAEAKSLPTEVTKPFGEFEIPEGLDVMQDFSAAAFRLSEAKPIHDETLLASNAVYLIALEQIIPSHVPPYEELLDRLYSDYRLSRAEQLCNEAGTNLFLAISNGLASGKTFEAIVGTNAEYIDLPGFSRQTRALLELGPMLPLRILQAVAFKVLEGKTAQYTETPTGGFILRVQKKVPVADDRVKESLAAYMDQQRREAYTESVNAWFTKQMQAAKPELPGSERSGN